MGGQEAFRGYFLQVIVGVLEALDEKNIWEFLILEPDLESEKVDIKWIYKSPPKTVHDQVKSSKNLISLPKVKIWAEELEQAEFANEYRLILLGNFSQEVNKMEKYKKVKLIKFPMNIKVLHQSAAHLLGKYLERNKYGLLGADFKERIIDSLVIKFSEFSTKGEKISRDNFDKMLKDWIETIAAQKIKKAIYESFEEQGFYSFDKWSHFQNISFPKIFVRDNLRMRIIQALLDYIKSDENITKFIRITGLPGIGKRRLIYEILTQLSNKNYIYYVKSETLKRSNLITKIVSNQELELILVIDECKRSDYLEYYEILANQGSRLILMTISEDPEIESIDVYKYRLKPLSIDVIKKILTDEFKTIPEYIINRFAEFSEGYPKFVLELAIRYEKSPTEYTNIGELTDDFLLNSFIAGDLQITSPIFEKTKKVLMGIALFRKIGYKDQLLTQAKWLCDTIIKVDWDDFQQIVKRQRERGLIEGDYYLRINPFLLETYLYCQWWETYGNFEDTQQFLEFIESFPSDLDVYLYDRFFYESFIARFKFLNSTKPGRELQKKLLSIDGIFSRKFMLAHSDHITLVCNLIESDIENGFKFLIAVINSWSDDELSQFINGRNTILFLLEKFAFRACLLYTSPSPRDRS